MNKQQRIHKYDESSRVATTLENGESRGSTVDLTHVPFGPDTVEAAHRHVVSCCQVTGVGTPNVGIASHRVQR